MSDELIQKVIDTTTIGDGNAKGQGGLTYEQSDRFIDYLWDATVLAGYVFTKRMNAVEEEWSTIAIGTRLMRGATEAVDTGENQGPTFKRLSITTKKLRLDWELSSESLEDNIEGEALEDHIARMMATQAATDLEDLAINGDTSSSDPLLKVFNGWRKQAISGVNGDGARVISAGGRSLDRVVFNKALKAMPRKYMTRAADLKFFAGSNAIQDWLFSFQAVENGLVSPEAAADRTINQAVRTEGNAGFTAGRVFGKPIVEVPLFSEERNAAGTGAGDSTNGNFTELWLTFPKNLIWGVKRDIKVYRQFAQKKDTIEYTVYCRQGVAIENMDCFVVVQGVKIAA